MGRLGDPQLRRRSHLRICGLLEADEQKIGAGNRAGPEATGHATGTRRYGMREWIDKESENIV